MTELVYVLLPDMYVTSSATNFHHTYGMRVFLVAADVKGAAAVADHAAWIGDIIGKAVILMADGLRLMDMTEGKVVVAASQRLYALRPDLADLDVVSGRIHACHCKMSHHDNGPAVLVVFGDPIQDALLHVGTLAAHVREGDDVTEVCLDHVVLLPTVRPSD